MINEKAFAKINLTLDVLGRLPDGYHQVEMIMQQIDLWDELFIEVKGEKGILIECNEPEIPTGEENLIHKAVTAMLKQTGYSNETGIKVRLEKNIPMAAGLAGGSSNAAAAMRGVNKLLGLGLSTEQLMEIAAPLGADIPFCFLGGTALAEGKGTQLTPLKSKLKLPVLVVKPSFGVSTAEIYKKLDINSLEGRPNNGQVMEALKVGDIDELVNGCGNVLEQVTANMHQEIYQIKSDMTGLGAKRALMSGSGPSVFAILPQDFSIGKRIRNYFAQKEYFAYLTTTI
ncbi:4-diphosphocytidyl-2-C-methyl-D-erythritol kinase [Desulfitispora alkaliphila]|uniref:4-(cytidine 5'-diphospho)-2-C-methyl-D-erythritol kinase n=1 Tax=Desulfitispora alkaliphila TaxID=622674 RepID=UPI003D236482